MKLYGPLTGQPVNRVVPVPALRAKFAAQALALHRVVPGTGTTSYRARHWHYRLRTVSCQDRAFSDRARAGPSCSCQMATYSRCAIPHSLPPFRAAAASGTPPTFPRRCPSDTLLHPCAAAAAGTHPPSTPAAAAAAGHPPSIPPG
jgi:hypothetical protein